MTILTNFIKAVTAFLTVFTSGEEMIISNLPSNPAPNGVNWQNLYRQVLYDFELSGDNLDGDSDDSMFAIRDLDSDGVPELLISPNEIYATACLVYTIADGEVKSLGQYGTSGQLHYYGDTDIIVEKNGIQGINNTYFYRLEDGEFKELAHFFDETDPRTDHYQYRLNDQLVTGREYFEAMSLYEGDVYLPICREFTFYDLEYAFAADQA